MSRAFAVKNYHSQSDHRLDDDQEFQDGDSNSIQSGMTGLKLWQARRHMAEVYDESRSRSCGALHPRKTSDTSSQTSEISSQWCDFEIGDRVRSTMRLPGSNPSRNGWDPLQTPPDEGVVTGLGRKDGEIMVKFANSDTECSLKGNHLVHIIPRPASHVGRSNRRRLHCGSKLGKVANAGGFGN
jgi:hypothetical protein